jgi:hypothetical protein
VIGSSRQKLQSGSDVDLWGKREESSEIVDGGTFLSKRWRISEKSRWLLVVAVACAAFLLAAGCGGSTQSKAGGGIGSPGPSLRPHYHETYYAAYVHDADGNNLEAVCHRPE